MEAVVEVEVEEVVVAGQAPQVKLAVLPEA